MISTFESIISTSERVAWKLDEVLPRNQALDFSRPFLPDALVRGRALDFLTAGEQLKLNQLRGFAYAHVFQFVEEFVVAACVQHASTSVFGDTQHLRAMLRFAEEEVKHQEMFRRFMRLFEAGFQVPCETIPSQQSVAARVLSRSPMAVMIFTLHLEVMTQQHYTQCVQSAEGLDPTFKLMLKSHWVEEAQHAKIDAMTLRKLALTSTPELRKAAIDDYFSLLETLRELLEQQAELDVRNLERATGKGFAPAQREALLASQRASYREIFLTWGLTNPGFLETVAEVFPEDAARIEARGARTS